MASFKAGYKIDLIQGDQQERIEEGVEEGIRTTMQGNYQQQNEEVIKEEA